MYKNNNMIIMIEQRGAIIAEKLPETFRWRNANMMMLKALTDSILYYSWLPWNVISDIAQSIVNMIHSSTEAATCGEGGTLFRHQLALVTNFIYKKIKKIKNGPLKNGDVWLSPIKYFVVSHMYGLWGQQ